MGIQHIYAGLRDERNMYRKKNFHIYTLPFMLMMSGLVCFMLFRFPYSQTTVHSGASRWSAALSMRSIDDANMLRVCLCLGWRDNVCLYARHIRWSYHPTNSRHNEHNHRLKFEWKLAVFIFIYYLICCYCTLASVSILYWLATRLVFIIDIFISSLVSVLWTHFLCTYLHKTFFNELKLVTDLMKLESWIEVEWSGVTGAGIYLPTDGAVGNTFFYYNDVMLLMLMLLLLLIAWLLYAAVCRCFNVMSFMFMYVWNVCFPPNHFNVYFNHFN